MLSYTCEHLINSPLHYKAWRSYFINFCYLHEHMDKKQKESWQIKIKNKLAQPKLDYGTFVLTGWALWQTCHPDNQRCPSSKSEIYQAKQGQNVWKISFTIPSIWTFNSLAWMGFHPGTDNLGKSGIWTESREEPWFLGVVGRPAVSLWAISYFISMRELGMSEALIK